MSLWRRLRGAMGRGGASGVSGADARYLAEWVHTHTGVEGYVEPKTTVTDVTVVLVAADGEWTRRIVGEAGARKLAGDLRIPVYDVAKTGYPQRMRDFDERKRIERRRAFEEELRDL
ncbi:oxidoreductase [Nocardia shimofusensis]|uniref:oxidoreductase n=1 Tax=Nocardia shimofusensis TaxID=228596 RepID=UPI00082E3407|nr:oxidoreductase [Nocardia shimofusensis]